ncbi:PH domain-containing protein [Polaribacter sp.]|nr:PH domain-containing protein [Polaribacter sp.]
MTNINYNPVSISPNQLLNIGYLSILLALIYLDIRPLALLALIILILKALDLYCTTWTIHQDNLIEKTGILNVNTEEVLLYRVKDIRLYEPLLYRLVGLSKLTIITSDYTNPSIVLYGIRNGEELMKIIRQLVANSRKIEGVKELDIR